MAYNTNQDILLNDVKNNTADQFYTATSIYIDDTVEHTGPFFAIYVVAEAVIDTSECTIGITDAPATITLVVNTWLYGNFPSIELDSGHVIAYAKSGIAIS